MTNKNDCLKRKPLFQGESVRNSALRPPNELIIANGLIILVKFQFLGIVGWKRRGRAHLVEREARSGDQVLAVGQQPAQHLVLHVGVEAVGAAASDVDAQRRHGRQLAQDGAHRVALAGRDQVQAQRPPVLHDQPP